jgi:hypothetical protein
MASVRKRMNWGEHQVSFQREKKIKKSLLVNTYKKRARLAEYTCLFSVPFNSTFKALYYKTLLNNNYPK